MLLCRCTLTAPSLRLLSVAALPRTDMAPARQFQVCCMCNICHKKGCRAFGSQAKQASHKPMSGAKLLDDLRQCIRTTSLCSACTKALLFGVISQRSWRVRLLLRLNVLHSARRSCHTVGCRSSFAASTVHIRALQLRSSRSGHLVSFRQLVTWQSKKAPELSSYSLCTFESSVYTWAVPQQAEFYLQI